ncbi:hypothetical protein FOCC_FOCC012574 [Frankliniella occidentalis]|nr:hypothetical protein FOCC_FOCC012574 [Frankliniella occidentalis]
MGHYLRCGLQCRLPKFIFESSKSELLRCRNPFLRVLVNNSSSQKDFHSENSPVTSIKTDENLPPDYSKFQDERKISLPKSTVIAEDYSTIPQDDPDNFGTLTKSNNDILSVQEGSEEDKAEDKFISELPNYYPQKTYANMIKKYLRQRRFQDAVDVLMVTMLKEHRVKPEYYIYSILISYCGLTGYSKMAFKLYNDMKRRGLPVKDSVYTSLFNSYANSPYPSDGLQRTRHLFTLLTEKGININQITCHAILKAFARCGSIEEAFKLVDYMMSKKMTINKETMSFLFQACISDKDAGFRHALLVYRKMMQYRMKPDVFQFNLLLRCVRDCGLGDIVSTIDVFQRLGVENVDKLNTLQGGETLSDGYPWEEDPEFCAMNVAGSKTNSELQNKTSDLPEISSPKELLPDLLSQKPTLGCVVSLMQIEKPQDRLFLLGGVERFMREMDLHEAKPDIKTFNLMLECIPQTVVAEQDVLPLIASHGFQPDLMTYTNLAMTCRQKKDAYELLKAMDQTGVRPGVEFITAMFGCATSTYNMSYINLVLDVIDYEEIKVNKYFIKKAEDFYEKCLRVLKARPEKFRPETLVAINNFCSKYPEWKKHVEVEKDEHPWQHLRDKHPPDSKTDEEFFSEHVENYTPYERTFSRLGPTTSPKVRLEKLKKLKQEDPGRFKKKWRKKSSIDQLEGIPCITYQKIQPK